MALDEKCATPTPSVREAKVNASLRNCTEKIQQCQFERSRDRDAIKRYERQELECRKDLTNEENEKNKGISETTRLTNLLDQCQEDATCESALATCRTAGDLAEKAQRDAKHEIHDLRVSLQETVKSKVDCRTRLDQSRKTIEGHKSEAKEDRKRLQGAQATLNKLCRELDRQAQQWYVHIGNPGHYRHQMARDLIAFNKM